MESEENRTCVTCGLTKEIKEFPLVRGWHKRRCRDCELERVRKWERARGKFRRPELPHDPNASKKCARCGEVKKAAQFVRRLNRGVGLDTYCRDCRNLHRREVRLRHIDRERLRERKRTCKAAGITLEELDRLLNEHDGRCEICGDEVGSHFYIDHCHKKGEYRGLLCGDCNLGLGKFKDDSKLLRAAANYLERA